MMYSSREQTYARQECTRGGGNTPGPRVAGPGRVGTRRGGTGARGGYIFLGVPVDSFGALVLAAGELRAEERASLPVSAVTPGMAEKPTHVAHTGRNTHASLRTGLANRGPTYLTPHTSLILFQRVLVESAGAAPRFEQALPPRDRLLSASGRQAVGDGVGTCPSVPTRRRSAHFLRPLPGEGAVLLTPPPMSLAAAEVCSTRLAGPRWLERVSSPKEKSTNSGNARDPSPFTSATLNMSSTEEACIVRDLLALPASSCITTKNSERDTTPSWSMSHSSKTQRRRLSSSRFRMRRKTGSAEPSSSTMSSSEPALAVIHDCGCRSAACLSACRSSSSWWPCARGVSPACCAASSARCLATSVRISFSIRL
mmetsp:Transcript_29838/g.69766  ORF Transcript_29838/g.69766 Transcript_29838/m.69766 type:complete len:369 (-) Transcript_29838:2786-3892(-)